MPQLKGNTCIIKVCHVYTRVWVWGSGCHCYKIFRCCINCENHAGDTKKMPQLKGNIIKACCTFYEHFFFFCFYIITSWLPIHWIGTGWYIVLHPLSLCGSTYSAQVAPPQYDLNCVQRALKIQNQNKQKLNRPWQCMQRNIDN